MSSGQIEDERHVERFDEAGVDHGRVDSILRQNVRRPFGGQHGRANRKDRDIRSIANDLRSADRQRGQRVGHRYAHAGAAGIANRDRARGVGNRGGEHVPKLVLVLRRHHCQVRDAAQVAQVEDAVVRAAIVSGESGPV